MKKVLVVFGVALFIFVIYRLTPNLKSQQLWEGYETIPMTIEDVEYILVIADTPEHWQQGLMHVRKPVPYDGMVFMFDQPAIQTFWNKNTYEDLTIYWMRDGKVVGEDLLPSITRSGITTITSSVPVDMVVEIIQ